MKKIKYNLAEEKRKDRAFYFELFWIILIGSLFIWVVYNYP